MYPFCIYLYPFLGYLREGEIFLFPQILIFNSELDTLIHFLITVLTAGLPRLIAFYTLKIIFTNNIKMSGLDKHVIGSLNMLDNLSSKLKQKQEEKFTLQRQVVKLKSELSSLTQEKGDIEEINQTIYNSKQVITDLELEKCDLECERNHLQGRVLFLKKQCAVYGQVTHKMKVLEKQVEDLEKRKLDLER